IGTERIRCNCAGTGNAFKTAARDRESGEIRHFPLDAFERIIQINLIGTFRCIAKSAAGMLTLPPLDDGERGAIVNTASVAAEDGQMGQAAYSASKAGVVGLTLPVARDLMDGGIRVNTILPGIFDTPLLARAPERVKANFSAEGVAHMPVEFERSWNDAEVESFRDSWVRFVETEMQPHDEEARKRGHVGHDLWRRAGALGFLCVDIPEEWGGAGGD